jgi:AmmeMemoRadiSam system protein A
MVTPAPLLDDAERQELLRIARVSLREYLTSRIIPPGGPHCSALVRPAAAFVSLHRGEALCGCIGTLSRATPLYRVVQEMSIGAATRDRRFAPLELGELADLTIEISVLGLFEPVDRPPDGIEIGRHGLSVHRSATRGLLLPQVAIHARWNAAEFLGATCKKAGLAENAWQLDDTVVERFSAQVFGDANASI